MPCETNCAAKDCAPAADPAKFKELERYIDSLPLDGGPERNKGYLIQCLHKAQSVFGFLPEDVQLFVANKLGIHLSEVYGVVSFYSFFTTTPVGKYRINVCTGTACFVKGSIKVLDEFKRYLSIDEGQTTGDMKFTLGGLRCVGACSLAPVVMVNERVFGNVTPKMVPEIIQTCD